MEVTAHSVETEKHPALEWRAKKISCFLSKIADFMALGALLGGNKWGRTADRLHAIVPEGETQRYKVRRNSIYQTKSELL